MHIDRARGRVSGFRGKATNGFVRPSLLFPLFAETTSLPGVGKQTARLLERLAGGRVIDLLWHLPSGVLTRVAAASIMEAPIGVEVLLTVTVDQIEPGQGKRPTRIRCRDASGFMHLIFFQAAGDYLMKSYPIGASRQVAGRIELFNEQRQIVHPDLLGSGEDAPPPTIQPVYPLTSGLASRALSRIVASALARVPSMPEWIEPRLLRAGNWPSFDEAIRIAHAPGSETDLAPAAPARARLAYDELLSNQLALALVRETQRRIAGRSLGAKGDLRRLVLDALPFTLTEAQIQAVAEIDADMAAPTRMLRLLQGDVGSGKTVVALLTIATVVEAGCQAAFLAPTELLARQHLATLERFGRAAGLRIALLTGRERGKPRAALLDGLAAGTIDVAVGTHALIQDDVAFRDLALAVIDEQHRFGVEQRLAISAKGRGVDMLAMTATPIPRTLMLTTYGDLDVSRLTGKPAGRQPIDTRALPLDRLDLVLDRLGEAIGSGARAYWVCPLVEEAETTDLAAAEARFRVLDARYPGRIGLVHGRMKGAEKDRAMARFAAGEIAILVATTVIEVGVDVPEATIMVIEHAERFGLAQLHQLRGRVGRGDRPSSCLLLYQPPLGETAERRLRVLRETEDGFQIAEEDLRLRGGGEVLGTRQSGLPEFRVAELPAQEDLLRIARSDAEAILRADPALKSPRGEALRVLLYLFERDAAVRALRGG